MRQRPFRPGFDHSVDAPPGAVRDCIVARLESGGAFSGKALERHLQLTVLPTERHLWSPHLHLEIVAHTSEESSADPQRAYVRGFFTPHPSLWTAFIFTYLALATIAVFSGMWAFVEMLLDGPPQALWITIAATLMAGVLRMVSSTGQKLAAEQMEALHAEIEGCLRGAGAMRSDAVHADAAPTGA